MNKTKKSVRDEDRDRNWPNIKDKELKTDTKIVKEREGERARERESEKTQEKGESVCDRNK